MSESAHIESYDLAVGTLALGAHYRALAKLLAADLWMFNPELKLYILTDQPDLFASFPNVVTEKHSFGGINSCYHDKKEVVRFVLQRHDACLFLDSDSRLIAKVDVPALFSHKSFVTGISVDNQESKLNFEIEHNTHVRGINSPARRNTLLRKFCAEAGVNFSQVKFVNESFFLINKKHGDYMAFLNVWDKAAKYLTLRLFEFSEGSAIGIGAEAVGGSVARFEKIPDWYFNDMYTKDKESQSLKIHAGLKLLRLSIADDYKYKRSNKLFKIALMIVRYVQVLSR